MPLLEIENLTSVFDTPAGEVRAVNGVNLSIEPGEIVGLVGESGCGKTVLALSILRLLTPPGRIRAGRVLWQGEDLLGKAPRELRKVRGAGIAMIFQEPGASLNPVFTVGHQIAETIVVHRKTTWKEARRQAVELLHTVSLPDPERHVDDYPHQLSGGMQQRVMIALALCGEPSLLIADEATTALDVTVQAQILELIARLRRERNLAVLLITHDLGVVAEVADRVAVMYTGRVVEEAPVHDLFRSPRHPYTEGLLRSIPRPGGGGTGSPAAENGRRARLPAIAGTVPDLAHLPEGCAFGPRCPDVFDDCHRAPPPLFDLGGGRAAACEKHRPAAEKRPADTTAAAASSEPGASSAASEESDRD